MSKLRFGLGALVVGILVGARARRRAVAEAVTPPPGALPYEVRAALAATEGRLTATLHRLDRARRRTGAVTFAIAVLIAVPAAVLVARPDVPDAVVAGVLAVDLLAAAVALVVAMRLDSHD